MLIQRKNVLFFIALFIIMIFSSLLIFETNQENLILWAGIWLLLGSLNFLIINHLIMKKVNKLITELKNIRNGRGDILKIRGKDELSTLSEEINIHLRMLKEKIEEIEENRKIYEKIAEKSEEIIILFNKKGEIIYANPKALEYLGDSDFRISNEKIYSFIKQFLSVSEEEMTFWHEIVLPDGTFLSLWIIPVENKSDTMLLIAHDITFYKKEKEKLFEIATKDPLTSLYNRNFLEENLKKFIENTKKGRLYSVLFLDMDGLKQINDQFGHIVGDTTIRTVSNTITKSLRANDLASRWGGDEFIIIIQGGEEAAKKVAERIKNNLAKTTIEVGTHSFTPSVSIGITNIESSDTIEELIKRADEAVYKAKSKGKGEIEYI